jgi:hypothetical protein
MRFGTCEVGKSFTPSFIQIHRLDDPPDIPAIICTKGIFPAMTCTSLNVSIISSSELYRLNGLPVSASPGMLRHGQGPAPPSINSD